MERFLSNLRVRLEERISPNMMRVIRPFMTVQFVIFMLLGILPYRSAQPHYLTFFTMRFLHRTTHCD